MSQALNMMMQLPYWLDQTPACTYRICLIRRRTYCLFHRKILCCFYSRAAFIDILVKSVDADMLDTTESDPFADVEDEDELEESRRLLKYFFVYRYSLLVYCNRFVHVHACYSNSRRGDYFVRHIWKCGNNSRAATN